MIDNKHIEQTGVSVEGEQGSLLAEFHKVIEAQKVSEEKTGRTRDFSVDFTNGQDFIVQDLLEDDRKMWERVTHPESGIVSKEEFEEYRARVTASANPTRSRFVQFLAGRLSVIWGKEELKQFKQKAA